MRATPLLLEELGRGEVKRGCDWIRGPQVVLITGATGTGKTLPAPFARRRAVGASTRYYRLSRLLGELALARADGS